MFNPPTTLDEARAYRYNEWSGNPTGWPYQDDRCAYEVSDRWLTRQCRFNPGHGPAKLYCKQHAKKVEEKA